VERLGARAGRGRRSVGAADDRRLPRRQRHPRHAALSGQQIPEILARDTIDLVVLDLKLPGEDGCKSRASCARSLPACRSSCSLAQDEADRVMGLELAPTTISQASRARAARAHPRAAAAQAARSKPWADGCRKCAPIASAAGAERAPAPPDHAEGDAVSLTNTEFNLLAAFLAARSAAVRATSCSACRACTTTRCTTARSIRRSAAFARVGRRKRGRADPHRGGAGYVFTAS